MMADSDNSDARKPVDRGRPSLLAELRTAAPVFIPSLLAGGVIGAIEVLLYPVLMAGPELEKRLRPHVERLDAEANLSLAKRALRFAMRWLLAERGSEPDTTECIDAPLTAEQAALVADLGLRREKQKLPLAGASGPGATAPTCPQDNSLATAVSPADATRGAH